MAADVEGLPWVCLFLVAVAGLFVWTTWRRLGESENPPIDVVALVWTALAATGRPARRRSSSATAASRTVGWLALAAHGIGLYALGRWTPRFQYVAGLAPALSLATLGLWWFDNAGVAFDNARFAWLVIFYGGLYAAGAFALMWNAARPGFWAALSVSAALAHFLFCWWVLRSVAAGTPWGLISIGLAAPFLVAAERLAHWRARMTGATEALGFLAAGVTFFIAAAIPMELSREWITVAYAIELAAVAYIAASLDLVAMRQLCWPLLAVVIVRFVLNPEVLQYGRVFWGYAISVAALAVATRFLADDRLRRAVQAGAVLLAFVMVTLEVRILFRPGDMDAPDADFLERSVYVAVWGAFALAALWIARLRHDPVALWAWRLSGGLAVATVLVIQVLIANPVFERADVGALPIANGLLLAYALPAVLAFAARRWTDIERSQGVNLLAEVTAAVLVFVYVSLEVRHLFDPGFERRGLGAEGLELYTYSIVWLLFGVALLALGFWRDVPALRHAGMALVCLVVAKVFLIDMAGLKGLLRVFSFLGLGAALLGLGYAYRRFGLESKSAEVGHVSRVRSVARRLAHPAAHAPQGGIAPRLRPPGAVPRQVRGGGRASRRSALARRPEALSLHRQERPARRLSVRHVRHPARAVRARPRLERHDRPADGGRLFGEGHRDLGRADGALALCRRRPAGRHHPQCLRLRPVHRRAGRALRRRAARLHGGADVGRLRRAAGPADPRVRRAGRADDAVLHAGDRRRVRAPGRRPARARRCASASSAPSRGPRACGRRSSGGWGSTRSTSMASAK